MHHLLSVLLAALPSKRTPPKFSSPVQPLRATSEQQQAGFEESPQQRAMSIAYADLQEHLRTPQGKGHSDGEHVLNWWVALVTFACTASCVASVCVRVISLDGKLMQVFLRDSTCLFYHLTCGLVCLCVAHQVCLQAASRAKGRSPGEDCFLLHGDRQWCVDSCSAELLTLCLDVWGLGELKISPATNHLTCRDL